ncbi:MAG: hypothetical protein PH343_05285, partial [Nitrospira sp.]|nr:hypothetical protein [Nitrospira sp.]
LITIAPEITGGLKLIKQASDMGIVVSMGHSDLTYAEAEAGFHAGAKGITHLFNAMSGFHHREPGLAGFGLLNNEIYAEVIADPYHLHPKTLELIFRTKNTEKIILISDTIKSSGVPEKDDEKSHPHLNPLPEGEETSLPFKGRDRVGMGLFSRETGRLLGGAMTVVEASNRLIEAGYDKTIVTGCITKNPEKYLKGIY